MKNRALLLMLLGAVMPLCVALACWVDVPLEQVVQQSPVVVTGKIVKIDVGKPSDHAKDTAHIRVDRVLKNALPISIKGGGAVLLVMPGKNRRAQMSTDITYELNQEGVWILETSDKGNTFAATYPKDFQPLEKEKEVAEIIANQQQKK